MEDNITREQYIEAFKLGKLQIFNNMSDFTFMEDFIKDCGLKPCYMECGKYVFCERNTLYNSRDRKPFIFIKQLSGIPEFEKKNTVQDREYYIKSFNERALQIIVPDSYGITKLHRFLKDCCLQFPASYSEGDYLIYDNSDYTIARHYPFGSSIPAIVVTDIPDFKFNPNQTVFGATAKSSCTPLDITFQTLDNAIKVLKRVKELTSKELEYKEFKASSLEFFIDGEWRPLGLLVGSTLCRIKKE